MSIPIPTGVPELLRDLIHQNAGIYFDNSRLDTLLDKLRDRVEARKCPSYLDYYYILKYEEKGDEEWLRVMDAFSVQETFFWREAAQLQALVEVIVPAWFKSSQNPLHIWSAACSTGEEPYSISIALHEAGLGYRPIHIHATDASESALAKARTAVYRERSFRSLPPLLRTRYFESTPQGNKLRTELLHPIDFQRANLANTAEITPFASSPIIFCRNVFIYFSPEAVSRTVALFAQHMPAKGNLFVGASESLIRLTQKFEIQEIGDAFVYIKKDIA
ncbi:MAG TPA: protein-glutamate O-methyltransferase CheR [Opitutaceae bacterium]|nr:protein-glutamate O-methyltransferase CheR [Opitutaceae bacterium]